MKFYIYNLKIIIIKKNPHTNDLQGFLSKKSVTYLII